MQQIGREFSEKVGHCKGLVTALVVLKEEIGHENNILRNDIPNRHVRLRKPHEDKITALKQAYDRTEKKLRSLQAHLR